MWNNNDTLDACLERVRGGESVATLLHAHPQAEEFEPLLLVAEQLNSTPVPALGAEARERTRRMMQAAVAAEAARRRRPLWPILVALRGALALVVSVGAIGGAGVVAAQSSIPGAPLYSVKRATEDVRLQLAGDAEARAQLHILLAAERAHEAVALAEQGQRIEPALLRDMIVHQEQARAEIAVLPPAEARVVRALYRAALEKQLGELAAAPAAADAGSWAVITAMTETGRAELARVEAPETPGGTRPPLTIPDTAQPGTPPVAPERGPSPTQPAQPPEQRPREPGRDTDSGARQPEPQPGDSGTNNPGGGTNQPGNGGQPNTNGQDAGPNGNNNGSGTPDNGGNGGGNNNQRAPENGGSQGGNNTPENGGNQGDNSEQGAPNNGGSQGGNSEQGAPNNGGEGGASNQGAPDNSGNGDGASNQGAPDSGGNGGASNGHNEPPATPNNDSENQPHSQGQTDASRSDESRPGGADRGPDEDKGGEQRGQASASEQPSASDGQQGGQQAGDANAASPMPADERGRAGEPGNGQSHAPDSQPKNPGNEERKPDPNGKP
jgi:hypothetical protein